MKLSEGTRVNKLTFVNISDTKGGGGIQKQAPRTAHQTINSRKQSNVYNDSSKSIKGIFPTNNFTEIEKLRPYTRSPNPDLEDDRFKTINNSSRLKGGSVFLTTADLIEKS